MKLAFEIVSIWTALNFVVGIPVWMLVKLRDRREMLAEGLDWEASAANELSAGRAHAAHVSPGVPNPVRPFVVAARHLVPDAGPAMLGAVHRSAASHRSIADV